MQYERSVSYSVRSHLIRVNVEVADEILQDEIYHEVITGFH